MLGRGKDRRLIVDEAETVVTPAEGLDPARDPVGVARHRSIKGHGVVGLGGLQTVKHVFLAHLEVLRKLAHRWRPTRARADLALGVKHLAGTLLGGAVDMECPPGVTEVALQLTDDRRDGERREREPAVRVEPLHRFHETETRHLHEVVVGLTRRHIPPCQLARERQVPCDQFIPRRAIREPPPPAK